MKFVFYTNSVSPHQLPQARAIIDRIGEESYRYIYTTPLTAERVKLGWNEALGPFIIAEFENRLAARETLLNADVMMSGLRDIELFERRAREGRKTIYSSERWFKPALGILRLLRPSYLKMALRFVKLLRKSDKVLYYPIGIHAARDMARLSGLVAGDLRCLFRAPTIDFEKKAGGRVWLRNRGDNKRYCLDKMRMWGYFVAPATTVLIPAQEADETQARALRVLWVGRLLRLKRVDTLFKAVYAAQTRYPITLTIVGQGPEQARLAKLDRRLAKKYGVASPITVHAAVPVAEVRAFMRSHELYVLPSNAYEGWGAVVSEALEEGMEVLGTYEAGSSATVLPQENLFHAGDWRTLRDKLVRYAETRQRRCQGIGMWSAKQAAAKLSILGQEKCRIV